MSRFNFKWHNYLEGSANLHSSCRGNEDFGFRNHGDWGSEPTPVAFPGVSDPSYFLEEPSEPAGHGLGGGMQASHSSPSNLSYIYANLIQDGSASNLPCLIQRSSPAQATRYDIDQTGICFDLGPIYPCSQQQQPACSFRRRGFHPNINTGNLAPSPLPSHWRTARGSRRRDNVTNCSSPGHACDICGILFKRQTDLNRHLTTARKHLAPHGPVCPELGCKYTGRFTRVDNFRAHYRKQHGKTKDEVNGFIQEWKDLGSP